MKSRYYSLDVFRGATVAFMILVNNPGNSNFVFSPLDHAPWHGCTPTDLVFPFFLFAVGNALSFVLPRVESEGEASFWKKTIKRSLLIYLIGLFLTWWPFFKWQNDSIVFKHWVDPSNPEMGIRILGVLPRIALCYFFGAVLLHYLKSMKAFLFAFTLLILYWALCFWLGNHADPYSLQGWFGTAIDKKILGIPHMYKGEGVPFDPEGIMSTIPAIVEVIFGFFVGQYIQQKGKSFEMVAGLFIAGIAFTIAGYCWGLAFPINKKIWTSSFTLYTSGCATLTLATLIYFIEMKNLRTWWMKFFEVFGKNALFVFALSAFVPKLLWLIRLHDGSANGSIQYSNPWKWFYDHICAKLPGPPELGSLAFALCIVSLFWFVCFWLDRKKIYIRV